ncbi:hypothetical protein OC25_23825 [Pedobacter kyungheensis]|uniref:MobA/VirD2-like nuclease domain-containing protein n=1 Tax=Pedobacter kyungheensis TaxID=1069985 RepID=A0A0C1FCZ0_9SPHI|nr:relaxase/mobilization nuclease domain-containing protein [Pedobacter kyungheensis]KIA90932.1 hypothetical protein OC25_23825 [Pedobacter kyungheensis]
MVAKIESGKSIRGILHYNENKVGAGEAVLIMASGFAGDIEAMNFNQKLNRFQHLTALNTAVKTNALHISLNFDASDEPDNFRLQKIATDYMERIGFGDQPFLVYRHLDSSHPHIHIATTNIQKDGNRIDIHGIGYRLSEPARKAIEQKYGLVQAEGREIKQRQKLKPAVYGKKPTRQQISNIVTGVMRQYHYSSFEQYKAILLQYNILADRGAENTRMFENKGMLYAMLGGEGKPVGVPIKASQIYCKPTLKNLEKRFEQGRKKREPYKAELKELIDHLFSGACNLSRKRFQQELSKNRVDVVYRTSGKGQLYGVTFIDHVAMAVFNGSELGKAYSAKALSDRLDQTKEKVAQPINKSSVKPDNRLQTDYTPTYLPSPRQTNFLETILAQTQTEPGMKFPKRRKKRKKGKIIEQQQQITL